jgi:hypothetical protein
MLSCAGAPPYRPCAVPSAVEGELVVTGDLPEERAITLAEDGGALWRLESSSLEGELLSLAGHRIRVWGVPTEEPGYRASVLVDRYEMLPIDGIAPIIGTVRCDGGQLILSARGTDEQYLLAGPLSDALMSYSGFAAWVWGAPAVGGAPRRATVLDVRAYGILGPGARSPAPSDTLRSSDSR